MSKAVTDALTQRFEAAILAVSDTHGEHAVVVDPSRLREVAAYLRDDALMQCDYPVLCTAIDRLDLATASEDAERFEVIWEVRSMKHRHRIRLKVRAHENSLKVPSLTPVWEGMNWLERETFDMYGVQFEEHPDLRRIYLYDEFQGHPLRKDYPKEKRQPLVRRDYKDQPDQLALERELKQLKDARSAG